MSGLTIVEFLATIQTMRDRHNAWLDSIEASLPDALKADFKAEREAFDAAFGDLNAESLTGSLVSALDVLKRGHGISGSGADASLS